MSRRKDPFGGENMGPTYRVQIATGTGPEAAEARDGPIRRGQHPNPQHFFEVIAHFSYVADDGAASCKKPYVVMKWLVPALLQDQTERSSVGPH
jgi:hypothetical protein